MKRLICSILAGAALALSLVAPAAAQSSAVPSQIGYLTSSGCAQHVTYCFVQYGATIPISGSITATNPSVGTNNATAPTSSTQIGILDAGGKLQAASAANPVPVTGSFSSGVAQGSTTSGQTGTLGQAAATTASPTYTTATTNPISLDVHGSTRILNMDASGAPLDNLAPINCGINDTFVQCFAQGAANVVTLGAGTALAGKFGIDQTTPGTTNGVVVNSITAGTAVIGGVNINQTTNGTTNGVAIKDVNSVQPDFTTTAPAGLMMAPGKNAAGVFTQATQETCDSGNVANAIAACTLATTSGKTTYITGFTMSASGATAGSAVTCTLTGPITGTKTYIFTFPLGAAVPSPSLVVAFNPPLAASTTNTTIVASCPAGGTGNTHAAMTAEGLLL
jgi:hypothetical protein